MARDLSAMRKDYGNQPLLEEEAGADPVALFTRWFDEAVRSGAAEPNAMALATADGEGRPSVRFVLMKSFDAEGMLFYTNLESRKARELAENPHAAVSFWWPEVQRQVRLRGAILPLPDEVASAYFAARPRESQLGAWASRQSTPIGDAQALHVRYLEAEERFAGQETVGKPPWWGGYRLVPVEIEFWQGRSGRLHDRLRYRSEGGDWVAERLQP